MCYTQITPGIISLLTHSCISVALNIVVHPQLTYGYQSPYHLGLHTKLCNTSCSDSCNPQPDSNFQRAQYKLLAAQALSAATDTAASARARLLTLAGLTAICIAHSIHSKLSAGAMPLL